MDQNDLSSTAEKPGYIGVLPATVRYDTRLSASAKILYAELSALSESHGYCWAANDYFERLYGLSERTVIRLMQSLEKNGYIRVQGSGTTKRRIWCNLNPPPADTDKNVSATDKNVSATDKNVSATDKNVSAYIYNEIKELKKKTNTPITPKRGRRDSGEKQTEPNWKPKRFKAFWRYYPAIPDGNGHGRRPAKDRAIRAWDKLHADDQEIDAMAAALRRLKESRQWRDGVGIPYASTWLNSRAWREEVEELPGAVADEEPVYGRKDLVQL